MPTSAIDTWTLIERLLNISRTCLLHGPSGTGKSFAATSADHSLDRPLYSVTLTPDTPSAELRGHYVPVGNHFEWRDGVAIRAWRTGGRLVLNEIDLAGGDTLAFLLCVLDTPETAALTLPTGETVRPHERFQVVATMNGSLEDLPLALQDRFPVAVEVVEPHPNGIATLPADLQAAAAGTATAVDPARRISLRSWHSFAALRSQIGAECAALAVFKKRGADILQALRIANGATE